MPKNLLSISIILMIFSCNTYNPTATPDHSSAPNTITLSYLNGLGKVTTDLSASTTFDLGDIKASRDFYFLIRNIGDVDIRAVSITSDNPAFMISPAKVELLPPEDSSAISTILRVSAIHGRTLDGIGYTHCLPAGKNSATIRIAGTMTNSLGVDSSISVSAGVSVNALFMSTLVLSGADTIDLSKPPMYNGCMLAGVAWLPVYQMKAAARIVNNGNVRIVISAPETADIIDTISPGEAAAIALNGTNTRVLRLFSDNTIADHLRFTMGNDGAIYLGLTEYSETIDPFIKP
jgi:hypothetical protein